jgi:hypothetical protein
MESGKGIDKIKKYITCVERKAIELVRSRLLQPESSEYLTQKDLAVDYRQAEGNLTVNDIGSC